MPSVENLARVQQAVRVERALQRSEQREAPRAELARERVAAHAADAVVMRDAAAGTAVNA